VILEGFSIAKTQKKWGKNQQIFINGFQCVAKNIEANHLYVSYLGSYLISTNHIFFKCCFFLIKNLHKYVFVQEIGVFFNIQQYSIY
jgi:hypothetical protein